MNINKGLQRAAGLQGKRTYASIFTAVGNILLRHTKLPTAPAYLGLTPRRSRDGIFCRL